MSCIIPGGANHAETEENQSLVDATVPGGLWRSLKEADLLSLMAKYEIGMSMSQTAWASTVLFGDCRG